MEENRLSLVERAAARLRQQAEAAAAAPVPALTALAGEAARVEPLRPLARPRELVRDLGPNRFPGELRPNRPPQRRVAFDPDRLRQITLVDWAAGRSQLTEEFRIIKRQLLRHRASEADAAGGRRNLVMVTSVWPREGRTFTAFNLAVSIAMEPNRRALLVDACGNRNSLQNALENAAEYGWLDAIGDPHRDIAEIVHGTDIARLELLVPGHRRPHDRAEPLASDDMRRLLEQLADSEPERIVVIDAPPCLVSSDPSALAATAGETILVVEANRTQQQSVEAALELLRGSTRTYLVLNKTQLPVTDTSGFYNAA